MPVGNIDPRNDGFTRSSMLIGSEEYPSSNQQSGEKNAGYLMYQPVRVHDSYGGTAHTGGAGTQSTILSRIYLSGGKYDSEIYMTADETSSTSSIWLQIGAVHVSSVHSIDTTGTTIEESFTGATIASGWHTVSVYSYASGAEVYNCFSAIRQYEE